MHTCAIPSIYFYACNSNTKKVYLSKEVVDFILLHNISVYLEKTKMMDLFQPEDIKSLLKKHPGLTFYYGRPNSHLKPMFYVMSENIELITLFRMTF